MKHEFITQLKQAKVALVGLGITGMSMLRFLLEHDIQPDVFDANETPPNQSRHNELLSQVNSQFGPLTTKQFVGYDYVLISPGVSIAEPSLQFARSLGVEVFCDIELFARINTKPVIAVTGSNGKSTVVAWLTDFLNKVGLKAVACGNYGVPVLDVVDDAVSVFILELSSFQLDTTESLVCEAAAVLNVSPDHLDRYDSFADYAQSKRKIYQHAKLCIFNSEDKLTTPRLSATSEAQLVAFGPHQKNSPLLWSYNELSGELLHHQQPYAEFSNFGLTGHHNALNALAVSALASVLDFDVTQKVDELASYEGLIHRCQPIASFAGVTFVDDSKATNVASAEAAIKGLVKHKNILLLAGGDAKGAELNELSSTISSHVKKVFAFGKDKAQFSQFVAPMQLSLVNTLEEAVKGAFGIAAPGDVVLLSPACASIDMFSNYQARAAAFKSAVIELQREHNLQATNQILAQTEAGNE
jgi:UDP-N-acetylmuramoylalanine--D-glutamate ligase